MKRALLIDTMIRSAALHQHRMQWHKVCIPEFCAAGGGRAVDKHRPECEMISHHRSKQRCRILAR